MMASDFVRVAELSEIPEGTPYGAQLPDGERVCLVRVGDQVFGFEDRCSHAEFPLTAGEMVDQYVIECALHGARFDVRDGSVVELPATDPLICYEVKIENGSVWLRKRR
ncbi:MAG: (2Fe-2S)-binding protein [Gemmatimonadales bacterium]|nr:3-phenylpropionate/cinnamic acid dioxygenase ferredoxin subunit [bacterium HR33]GIW52908.1 MAG: (2Fe-2S)-binding protein [Gemmatimonadales bacterium]